MFQINHQLAKVLSEERRAQARRYSAPIDVSEPIVPQPHDETAEADVIEVAFGAYCEADRIGA